MRNAAKPPINPPLALVQGRPNASKLTVRRVPCSPCVRPVVGQGHTCMRLGICIYVPCGLGGICNTFSRRVCLLVQGNGQNDEESNDKHRQ